MNRRLQQEPHSNIINLVMFLWSKYLGQISTLYICGGMKRDNLVWNHDKDQKSLVTWRNYNVASTASILIF